MNKTIMITGASSGIGKATAEYFSAKGWNVAATMRNPGKSTGFEQMKNTRLYRLDVSDSILINETIAEVIKDFGSIDVVFNNAGYALTGIFEAMTEEQIKKQFDTNVFGLMNVTRAILPYFRERGGGTVINTTSVGGIVTFPVYSVYHSTKWAVEGFMESLQYEVRQFNIRIKNVEPGPIKTDFYDRSMESVSSPAYDKYLRKVQANMKPFSDNAPGPEVVAKKVFKAANDSSYKLRYPVGGNAPLFVMLRKLLPFTLFRGFVRMAAERGFKNG